MKVKSLTRIAIFAAIYAVLTLVIAPFSFGAIQCRVSMIMSLFCVGNKRNAAGYVIGTIIANLFSPLGIIDVAVGMVVSGIVAFTAYKTKSELATVIANIIAVSIFVGAELAYVYSIPFVTNAIYVAIGTAISCTVGLILSKVIKKNERVYSVIMGRD